MENKYYVELHKAIAEFIEKFGIEKYDEKTFETIFRIGWNAKDYSNDPAIVIDPYDKDIY